MDDNKFYAFSFIGEKGIFMKTPLRLFGAKIDGLTARSKGLTRTDNCNLLPLLLFFGVWAIFSLSILIYYEMASKADKSDSDKPF